MKNIRHIHEVLNILFNSGQDFTIEEFHNEIRSQFGETVQFTNCSENVFPLQEVIPFLLSRQKIRLEDDDIIPLLPACSN